MSEFIELPLSETDDVELKHKSLSFCSSIYILKKHVVMLLLFQKKALVLLTVLKGINSTKWS